MRCSPRQQHAWSVLPPRCEHVSGLAPSQSALALMWSRLTAVVRNHSLVAPISMLVPRCGWRIIRLDRATGHRQIVGKFLSRSRCSPLKEHRQHCLGCAAPATAIFASLCAVVPGFLAATTLRNFVRRLRVALAANAVDGGNPTSLHDAR